MNTIPPQGIGAVSLISEGTAPIPYWELDSSSILARHNRIAGALDPGGGDAGRDEEWCQSKLLHVYFNITNKDRYV